MTTDFEDILVNIRSKSDTEKFRINEFFKIKSISCSQTVRILEGFKSLSFTVMSKRTRNVAFIRYFVLFFPVKIFMVQSCLVMIGFSKLGF